MDDIKVLVVDDEEIISEFIESALIENGFSVITAPDGEQALKYFLENPVEIIITDLRLPKIDGMELTKEVRSINQDIPIILISGFAHKEDIEKAMELGCNYYLPKPLGVHVLLTCMEEAKEKVLSKKRQKEIEHDLKEARAKAELTEVQLNLKNALEIAQVAIERLRKSNSKIKEIQASVLREEKTFKHVFQRSPIGMLTVDSNFCVTNHNPAFTKIMSIKSEEIMGVDILFFPPFLSFNFPQNYLACEGDSSFTGHYTKPGGEIIFIKYQIVPGTEQVDGFDCDTVIFFEDITLETLEKEKKEKEARIDPLTGLLKYDLLGTVLSELVSEVRKNCTNLAVVFIDVDRFKGINDTFGHQIGDVFLQLFGKRIIISKRDKDPVFRKGGDEFIWLIRDYRHEELSEIVMRMFKSLNRPYDVQGVTGRYDCTFSFGVSEFSEEKSPDISVREADIALYQAKSEGRNRIVFFKEGMTMPN